MALRELQQGSIGKSVRIWQLFLASQGINLESELKAENEIFGSMTEKGTKEYQAKKGLPLTGVVNGQTYAQAMEDGLRIE